MNRILDSCRIVLSQKIESYLSAKLNPVGHLFNCIVSPSGSSSVILTSCRDSCVQIESLMQSNKNPSSECKFWQAGPSHNPQFPIFSIMRWSLVLYSLIALQSALSFVCLALAIPPQWDELERRAPVKPPRPRKSGPRPGDEWKLPSDEYRKNAKEHPYAYKVEHLGDKGKLTKEATVKGKLLSGAARSEHGEKMLKEHNKIHNPIHAGMLLRAASLQSLLISCAPIVDHVFEVQMLVDHLKQHGVQSVFTLILLHHFLIIFYSVIWSQAQISITRSRVSWMVKKIWH